MVRLHFIIVHTKKLPRTEVLRCNILLIFSFPKNYLFENVLVSWKAREYGFEAINVAYLNLTVGYSLLLTNTNNTFER